MCAKYGSSKIHKPLVNDIHGLNTKQITEMLSLTTKESIFLFGMAFYTQVDGVAMGSPLGSSLGNAFLCHHENEMAK